MKRKPKPSRRSRVKATSADSKQYVPAAQNYLRDWWEAGSRESELRDTVFCGVPFGVQGIPLRTMTLTDLVNLIALKSPLVCGGDISALDVANFLWFMSPAFTRSEADKEEFFEALNPLDAASVSEDVNAFLELMFLDRPRGGGGGVSYASFVSYAVDSIASEYGWTEAVILALPLPRLFQYQRVAAVRKGNKGSLVNSLTDRASDTYLTEINRVPEEHRARWSNEQWEAYQREKQNG